MIADPKERAAKQAEYSRNNREKISRKRAEMRAANRKKIQELMNLPGYPAKITSIDQTGPAPKLCGLCPLQARGGKHCCNHPRLAAKWLTEPASEARIYGACPWGRSILTQPTTEGEK